MNARLLSLAALTGLALTLPAVAAESGFKQGTADLKSAGPLCFGPGGVLFIGDSAGAAIFAIDTNDRAPAGSGTYKLEKIDEKIAALLGTTAKEIGIADMACNPTSGNVFFSVGRGRGPDAAPVILKLNRLGEFTEVPLKDVKYMKAVLPNPASGRGRAESITGLAFADGKLFVAGLSTEEFASTLRAIPFPFTEVTKGAGIQIFHGNHGKLETQAPIRTFTTYEISGTAHLLAAYTCTPLVKIPVDSLKDGAHVKGVTVAELGNRNKPLDMVTYTKGGKDYLLMANSARGVMKVELEKVGTIDGITAAVKGSGTAGLPFETVKALTGVVQLTKLDNDHALILVQKDGAHTLETIEMP